MKKELCKPFAGLVISSIEANAKSLFAQLSEYEHLQVTDAQFHELLELERKFHALAQEITEA